ncbi:SCO4848 family membrane protein [Canibacter zhoujuaniae]|uniref:SCO4848 family membrane protein n=1 Tax=Canibacter zhoujuaniae TaxID=2708343 RepID=UPI00141DF36B|nr:hypothetical protein [Canibacter zhoujuaniae]
MHILLSILLIINAVFNCVVWPPFLRRVKQDPRAFDTAGRPTRFFKVHLVLIVSALTLAAASLVCGVIGLLQGAN